MLRVGVVLAAVVGVTGAAVTVAGSQQPAEPTVIGYFADASPLDRGSMVRAAGVEVGSVQDISLQGGKARVTMEVNPAVLPLHRDAKLTIRPVNLLGERYIELDAGSPSKPYMREAVVPMKRTDSSVDLQDMFNTFDDPTSTALAALVTSLGEGMQDSGAEAAAAVKALAPAMGRTADLGGMLREQNSVLNQLVDRVRPVAQAFAAKDGKTLDRLVASTERTLSTLAANQQALDTTLAELPTTLTEARRTLRELAGVSDALAPTLKSVRPVTDNLTEITAELHRFADTADPALASLPPVLDRADTLLKQAAPTVERLRNAGPDLRATAKSLRPLGDQLLDKHLGDLMAFVKKWALSTNSRDALGHYFRAVAWVTPETLQDLASGILPASPSNSDSGKPLAPDIRVPGPKDLPDVVPQDLRDSDPGNATGLSKKQEQSLLDQLLGGA
ncbi:phospholipid/cholesterol/gamma-HCH transport system substrate-binding protein [Haloechinothrix alba]|uniref:Phospholipid/cholesterol/gamma-HCH transport system substrate-binding protein n=2 Tax=Haloechinothrix alba TaxID=664784 RepID=A0A239AHX2_9PSEU|nr:phospholipid/cholesterol/gamma-HCH transport system substrate-binding protein [Haloechinothrix alba]